MITIGIVKDFSETPGGRYKKDGPFSGEEFREQVLKPTLKKLNKNEKILIDLDGGYGYPVSFLEEAFGGIAREFSAEEILKIFEFKSDEEPLLIDEIKEYIANNAKWLAVSSYA